LTVCICDLDHFKSVNDNYGHQMGDQVLAAFGHMLIEEIRAEDTAGRYGGEEFALILPHTSTDQAVVVLERLRLRWAQRPFEAGGSVFHVTASFGLAAFQTDAPHPETILDRADRALYQAKRTGRNRIRVHGPEAAG
jgi:diguanylate cyclase (GGDEF)-like protein